MSDTSSNEGRFSSPIKGAGRSAPNVSGGWLVMVLSGLIAVVVFLFVTQQSGDTTAVSVLSRDVSAGQTITPGDLRQVNVNLPSDQLNRLIRFDDRNSVSGYVAAASLRSGDLLQRSSIVAPAAADGLRAMSIPAERSRSVAGGLSVGDRVDIIDTTQSFPNGFVAQNLQILSVNSGGSGITSSGSFSITVAVTSNDAVNLSKAINANKFDVVRSTGAAAASAASTASTSTTGPAAP